MRTLHAALPALPIVFVLSACGVSDETATGMFSSPVLDDEDGDKDHRKDHHKYDSEDIERGWCPGHGKARGLAPPVLDPVGAKSGFVAVNLAFQLTASDVKHRSLTFSAIGLPAGASLDPTTGVFTWTPTFAPAQTGVHEVLFVVDNGPCQRGERVTLTIAANQCLDALGAPIQCAQGDNACDGAVCLPGAGCTPRAVRDDTPCDDGHGCTSDDTCQAGRCVGHYTCTPLVDTDARTYAFDAPITVTYSGLYGHAHDWIALAPPGAPVQGGLAFQHTGGMTGGFMVFTQVPPGTYVARAFFQDDPVIQAESAPFTIEGPASEVRVTTSAPGYVSGDPVVVHFDGLPGFAHDWVAVAAAGAPPGSYLDFSYTGGQRAGTRAFHALPPGRFVARAFVNDGYVIAAESVPFTVTPEPGNVSVTTDAVQYSPGAQVTVSYRNMPRFAHDWIGIAAPGWPPQQYVAFNYTGGARDSMMQFGGLPAGTWVARAFENDGYDLLAESAPFFIGEQ